MRMAEAVAAAAPWTPHEDACATPDHGRQLGREERLARHRRVARQQPDGGGVEARWRELTSGDGTRRTADEDRHAHTVERTHWKPEEDQRLLQLVRKAVKRDGSGGTWAHVAASFPTAPPRTPRRAGGPSPRATPIASGRGRDTDRAGPWTRRRACARSSRPNVNDRGRGTESWRLGQVGRGARDESDGQRRVGSLAADESRWDTHCCSSLDTRRGAEAEAARRGGARRKSRQLSRVVLGRRRRGARHKAYRDGVKRHERQREQEGADRRAAAHHERRATPEQEGADRRAAAPEEEADDPLLTRLGLRAGSRPSSPHGDGVRKRAYARCRQPPRHRTRAARRDLLPQFGHLGPQRGDRGDFPWA